MDQETFNLSIRKFLKMVGVNSQREIEQAVQKSMQSGKLKGGETVPVKMTLEIPSSGREGALRRRDQTKIALMNKAREFDQSVVAELKALLGERVSTSAAVREHHGKDESYFPVRAAGRGRVRRRRPRKCATSSTSAAATACR